MKYATAAELAGLPGIPRTEKWAREAIHRLGVPHRPRVGRGGGVEYMVDALPLAARMAWAAQHAAHASNDAELKSDIPSQAEMRASATRQAALVIGWRKQRQEIIVGILTLFQRFWQEYGGSVWPAVEAFCTSWNHDGINATPSLRNAYPRLAPRTVQRWYTDVQNEGLSAVTPPEHHRRGRYTALNGEVGNAMLATLIERPHLSAQAVYEILSTQFADLPSSRSFRRALAHWKAENKQLLEAAINPDGWRNKFMSAAGSYSEGIVRPNQKWEMDSTVGDVMLADGRRHHIVGVIDVYTRRRMFIVTRTSRANAIMSLIRSAIQAWGVPEAIKTDNGADYTAQVLESALLGLAIEHPLCAPFSPHQKPHIERAIGALMHQLFELLDGYIGHSVAERKGIEARKGFAERIMRDKECTVELRLTPEQLQANIDSYCERRLHEPRSYLGNRSPAQMVAGYQAKTLPDRALDVLLAQSAKHGTAVVGKKGLRVMGGWYNHALLGGLEGQRVQVRIDESNLGRCWVFDLDGMFICEALDHARLGISSAEVAAERREHQTRVIRAQKQHLRRAKRDFDTSAAIDAVHRARTEQAIAAADNVVTIERAAAVHTSPTIESITAAQAPTVSAASIADAQLRLAAATRAPVAPIVPDTPQQRYARWLKLQQRVERNEALTADERNWFDGYAQGAEHRSMTSYFATFGLDADQVLAS